MDRHPSNRLRDHLASQRAQTGQKRLQRHIVREYRADIIGLIKDDGATMKQVVAAVEAEGENVLTDGFKAEVRKQIGTVKQIRAGRAAAPSSAPHAPVVTAPVSLPELTEEDDEDFRIQRAPRN